MNILGINFYQHNTSAALVQNGKLKSAVEEERLSRIKDYGGIPIKRINYCLKEASLTLDDIDIIKDIPFRNLETKIEKFSISHCHSRYEFN